MVPKKARWLGIKHEKKNENMTQQELHEVAQGTRAPEEVSMTLAEFLENDIDGYEYVNCALNKENHEQFLQKRNVRHR
ncbi:hypothetical protein C6499_13560 [Candidatus Poribacteria bacterium]|nr:MAG: hypothetical protein C6499_13560 [Candidatus Poribacteria bacterium]